VALARGKHLFPFRTEQLSPSAPMVLAPYGAGRVGRRRFFLEPPSEAALFVGRRCRLIARRRRRAVVLRSGRRFGREGIFPLRRRGHSYRGFGGSFFPDLWCVALHYKMGMRWRSAPRAAGRVAFGPRLGSCRAGSGDDAGRAARFRRSMFALIRNVHRDGAPGADVVTAGQIGPGAPAAMTSEVEDWFQVGNLRQARDGGGPDGR
jgi:hypothetical protein